MYRVIRGTIVSLSKAAVGVLLYLPVIFRRHWFWTLWSSLTVVLGSGSLLPCVLYICELYSIVGLTTAL